jgi:hypothetical protein
MVVDKRLILLRFWVIKMLLIVLGKSKTTT